MGVWNEGGGLSLPSQPPPPIRQVCELPIERVKTREGRRYVVVSDQCYGRAVHYNGLLNLPCTANQGPCWHDHRDLRQTTWQGWIAVVGASGRGSVALLAVTPETCAGIPALADGLESLRGLQVRIYRGPPPAPGKLLGEVLDEGRRIDPATLPPEPDVAGVVCRMWGRQLLPRMTLPEVRRRARDAADGVGEIAT